MVDKRFLGWLGCAGVPAAIVLLMPPFAFFGLGIAPALFIYLLAWWGLRWLCLKAVAFAGSDPAVPMARLAAGLLSVAVIVAVVIAIPRAINAPLEQQIAALQSGDVQPSGVIKLPAIVTVELPKSYYGSRGQGPQCEALCLRLLYNGVVSRVIAVAKFPNGKIDPPASFRIERRDQCPNADLPTSLIVWPGEWRVEPRSVGVRDRVRARVSGGECLVREAGRIEDAAAVISFRNVKVGASPFSGPWQLRLDTLNAERLEIVAAGGEVLYRRTEVMALPLAVPLHSTGAAGLLTTVTYVGWARSAITRSPLGPNGRDVLPGILGEGSRRPDLPEAARVK